MSGSSYAVRLFPTANLPVKELQKKSLLRERMTSRILKSLTLRLSLTITKGQEYDHKQLDFMKSSLGHQKVKQQKRLANTDAYSQPSTPGSLPKSPGTGQRGRPETCPCAWSYRKLTLQIREQSEEVRGRGRNQP